MMYDVLTALDICADVLLRGDVAPRFGQEEQLLSDYSIIMGGSAPIFACQCAKLGLRAAGIGVVGDDAFGAACIKTMRQSGVDTALVRIDPGRKTGVTFHLCKDSDRSMLTYLGTIDAVTPDMLSDDALRGARHLHIASMFLMPTLRQALPDIARRAKALGLTLSLDTNWDPDNAWMGVRELAKLCDVYMPNENELLAVTGASDIGMALAIAREWTPHVAVKLGEKGARYAGIGGEAYAPAHPVRIVDTIGAGDSFDGGFIWGYLNGKNMDECLRAGCAAGSMNTRAAGGTAAQADLEELTAKLSSP